MHKTLYLKIKTIFTGGKLFMNKKAEKKNVTKKNSMQKSAIKKDKKYAEVNTMMLLTYYLANA